jgi:hypothetical protein
MRYDDEEEGVSILSPGPVRPSAIAGIVGLLADYWQTRRPRPALRSSALDGGHEHAASSSKRLAQQLQLFALYYAAVREYPATAATSTQTRA